MNTIVKKTAKIGAFLGIALYPFAVIPAFYFGSYGALILMSKLVGGAVVPTLLVRMGVVAGIGIGLMSAACLMVVVGGLFGTAVGLALHNTVVKEAVAEKA